MEEHNHDVEGNHTPLLEKQQRKGSNSMLVVLSGLRGVPRTLVLAKLGLQKQLCFATTPSSRKHKLYIC